MVMSWRSDMVHLFMGSPGDKKNSSVMPSMGEKVLWRLSIKV